MRRLVSCLLPALLALVFAPAAVGQTERPNILWITCEDASATLGCYGDPSARTPHIDAFAQTAVRYTRAFAAAPVCSPSRATLISGVHANSLGNPHLRCEFPLPAGFRGYSAYLREAGYFTSNNVKTDYNVRDERAFSRECWSQLGNQAHWRQRTAGQPFMAVFNIMDTHQTRSSAWSEEEFERGVGRHLTREERADPKTVTVPPFYPDTESSRRAMARYYDCVTLMDKKVGAILRELEQDGLAEDTIVFFYSDHGMGMPRGKRLLYDSGMHVPLLIRVPKKWEKFSPGAAGSVSDRLVSFVDFAPTLLRLAGVRSPAHFQGQPFLGAPEVAPRRYVFGARDRVDEAFDTARSARDERWLYIRNYRPHLSWTPPEAFSDTSRFRVELRAAAKAGKLGSGPTAWLAPRRPREELYDGQADPHQLHNLADDPRHRATLERLRGALRGWLLEIRDASFLAEEEVFARVGDGSPYAWARRTGAYPFERVLEAAAMVGDPQAVAQQRTLLADGESIVRYWAAVGFAANPAGAAVAREELLRALGDSSAAVRIEAAGALLGAGGADDARRVLARELEGSELNAALHAARTLELAGELARPLLPQLRPRLVKAKGAAGNHLQFYISMSLGSLVKELDGGSR